LAASFELSHQQLKSARSALLRVGFAANHCNFKAKKTNLAVA
jgi:hypothetical protein